MARSRASVELERLVAERGGVIKAWEPTGLSYRMLRRYLLGECVPSIEGAVAIWHWSGGRVRVEDWAVPEVSSADPATVPDPGAIVRALAAGTQADPAAPLIRDVVAAIEAGPETV
jgi:hypothetical protein